LIFIKRKKTITYRMCAIKKNYIRVKENIKRALKKAGREEDSLRLIVVSKYANLQQMEEIIQLGHRDLGESRVQDAEKKITFFASKYSGIRWHMIGHLQTNKAGKAAALFDEIETVDSEKLLRRLQSSAKERGRILPVMIQVNIAEEGQKSGARLREVKHLIEAAIPLDHVELKGLMTIPPYFDDPERSRPFFKEMKELQSEMHSLFPDQALQELSMGMSNDYVVAIEEGATVVRIGSAIFGE